MMLTDVFKIIDSLTPNQKQQVKQYLDQQEQASLRQEINAILETAAPIELTANTLNITQFMQAVQGMWEGLSEDEIADIVQTMNEETIKQDESSHER